MTDYANLAKTIVRGIVDNPDAVEVDAIDRGRSTVIEIAVADSDVGKVIGKGGRNIESIRSVVRAAGLRQHERVQVDLRNDFEDEAPAAGDTAPVAEDEV